MLFDFVKTTSPDFVRSIVAIISGVISPVWRQETELSDGSASERLASMLATWQVTPGTFGSWKVLILMSLSVNMPSETSPTSSPPEQPVRARTEAAAKAARSLVFMRVVLVGFGLRCRHYIWRAGVVLSWAYYFSAKPCVCR